MERKYVDCRDMPSEIGCSLRISGTEEEVLNAATRHAVEEHREMNSPQLRQRILSQMKDAPGSRETTASSDASAGIH